MLSRAAHVTHEPARRSIVTEHVNGTCIQCEGRPTYRRTLDGVQPTVSFHWYMNCKYSSKAKVFAVVVKATTGSIHG